MSSTCAATKGIGAHLTTIDRDAGRVIRKRSIVLKGHATSVSLEDEFWTELKRMARRDGASLATLIETIDAARGGDNLSSALRLAVLAELKAPATRRRD